MKRAFGFALLCAGLAGCAGTAAQGRGSEARAGMSQAMYAKYCREYAARYVHPSPEDLAGKVPRAVCRTPPIYPEKCASSAQHKEAVRVAYDITPQGGVDNVRVIESSNACLNDAAVASVRGYEYTTSDNGAEDETTTVSFYLQK